MFLIMLNDSLSLLSLGLTYILSDTKVAIHDSFFVPFSWITFFYPLTLRWCLSLIVRFVCWRKQKDRSGLLIQPASICLFTGELSSLPLIGDVWWWVLIFVCCVIVALTETACGQLLWSCYLFPGTYWVYLSLYQAGVPSGIFCRDDLVVIIVFLIFNVFIM